MSDIVYAFTFEDGGSWEYRLRFDDLQHFVPEQNTEIRPWTRLESYQCAHCPLSPAEHRQCPIARNLDRVIEDSKNTISCKKALVTVTMPNRTCEKRCDTQEGLRSLFGVVMAASGCPHLDWLRPLTRFHLPFADIDETLFRVLSLQLIELYLTGDHAALSCAAQKIEERYRSVEKVNHSFIERVRSYCTADADKNALAALDIYVQLFPIHLQRNFQCLSRYF